MVPDVEDEIVAALNALRARYDYVFTTGGIGPTHDDITADAVAKAFGVGISEDPRAIALLLERIKPEDLNEARRRMARIPHGAELVANPISKAPGFWIGNVIVMAGVPSIMQAMLDDVAPKLVKGAKILSETHRRARPAGRGLCRRAWRPRQSLAGGVDRLLSRDCGTASSTTRSFCAQRMRRVWLRRRKKRGKMLAEISTQHRL